MKIKPIPSKNRPLMSLCLSVKQAGSAHLWCRTSPDIFSRSVSHPVEAVLGHCAEIWKESVCFVRWNHLCRCLRKAFCPFTISNFDPKVRHLWEKSCGKRFREWSFPLLPQNCRNSHSRGRKGWGCTIWFDGWSPVGAQALSKRKSQFLHGGAKEAQEEAMLWD